MNMEPTGLAVMPVAPSSCAAAPQVTSPCSSAPHPKEHTKPRDCISPQRCHIRGSCAGWPCAFTQSQFSFFFL